MDIGEKIKLMRLSKGFTLQEVGDKVGVSRATVKRWEDGQIENMKRDKIAKLAAALDCSPDYILGLTDERETLAYRRRHIATDITYEEQNLIECYHNATPAVQEAVRKLLDMPEPECDK